MGVVPRCQMIPRLGRRLSQPGPRRIPYRCVRSGIPLALAAFSVSLLARSRHDIRCDAAPGPEEEKTAAADSTTLLDKIKAKLNIPRPPLPSVSLPDLPPVPSLGDVTAALERYRAQFQELSNEIAGSEGSLYHKVVEKDVKDATLHPEIQYD